jgi:transposase, IS30 family
MARAGISREVERGFWRLIVGGRSIERAAVEAGVSITQGRRWFANGGGMAPMSLAEPSGRYLSAAERERIDLCWAEGWTQAEIARDVDRAKSTISRELARNRLPRGRRKPPLPNGQRRRPGPVPGQPRRAHYRAAKAQARAERMARRPQSRKLATQPRLRAWVQAKLQQHWSPEQIAARLHQQFPDDDSMRISHEAIYQALYVQGRGALRRELAVCLRTGRTLRKPRRRADGRRQRIKDKVMISERPAEVDDRAVPGHWEGDLIVGKNGRSAIGTLVERSTRFVMLLHVPGGPGDALAVRDQILATIGTLPNALRRSLTWDQGLEMRRHVEISIAADLPVYFCDPHSPWQRGSNENTNGLLRQYFPKGADLSVHTPADLAAVADRLNGRPRKTLGFKTPAEALTQLPSEDQQAGVATTT